MAVVDVEAVVAVDAPHALDQVITDPFRTAQRWVSLYRQFGLAGLARKTRTDNGQHREISAKLKEAIEGIALQKPPLPVTAICRMKPNVNITIARIC